MSSSTPNHSAAPKRRSIHERLSQPPTPPAPEATGGDASSLSNANLHLTDTSFAALGTSVSHDLAFRVEADGAIEQERATPVAQHRSRSQGPLDIDRHTAVGHHLLIVNDQVEDEEIEALAVSLWEGAGWSAPGVLNLGAGARMEGAWTLPTDLRKEFGVSVDKSLVWLLVCPPLRGPAPSAHAQQVDEIARAFPTGVPQGIEAKMLRTLTRMARRLAGTVRIAGSGALLTPDPDSAVSLTLYAARWLDPADLFDTLRDPFTDVVDARDVAPHRVDEHSRRSTVEAAKLRRLIHDAPPVKPEIRARIDADLQQATENPQIVDAYAALFSVGNRSQAMVEVRPILQVPQALRWEPWARGPVVEYRLRWLPGGTLGSGVTGMSRAARLERTRSARDIETAAGLIFGAIGGAVLDEDGFLVALDAEAKED